MEKTEFFSMRVTPLDRAALDELARRLEVPRSEAVRTVVREVVTILREKQNIPSQNQKGTNGKKTK